MSLADLFHAIQTSGLPTYIRESELTYPVIMTTHLASIAVFGGMILMTDLRLLNVAMRKYSVSEIVGVLRPFKWVGFVVMVTCGILLAASKADQYYPNPYFRMKMSFLGLVILHGLFFRPRVYSKAAAAAIDKAPRIPPVAKFAAVLSLLLWSGLVCAGRWIAYYEAPKPKPAALLLHPEGEQYIARHAGVAGVYVQHAVSHRGTGGGH